MNYTLFIARRLYNHKGDRQRVSRPAIRIATAGVAIGLAVMIIAISVVLGFKKEIYSKVIGFGSHIQVLNYETLNTQELFPIQINDSLLKKLSQAPNVAHVQRFCYKPGMLKTEENFKGIQFKGVGPEFDSSFLKANLISGQIPSFSDTTSTNKIVISQQIADELHLKVGSKLFAYFFEESVRARRFVVAGIYCTNLTEFDNGLVFTDLYTCNKLNNWKENQYSGAELEVKDYNKLEQTSSYCVKNINRTEDAYGASYTSMTIKELYPQIFAWLDLLDINVWIIMVLMISVAGFTMISGLLIIILERTSFIGVMKALGTKNSSIRHIFLYFSVFIIGKGMLWGNILGLGLIALQVQFGFMTLDPTVYYVETVPMLLNLWYVLGINLATFLVSVLVLIIPSFLISNIHPVKSIQFE